MKPVIAWTAIGALALAVAVLAHRTWPRRAAVSIGGASPSASGTVAQLGEAIAGVGGQSLAAAASYVKRGPDRFESNQSDDSRKWVG